MEGGKLLFQLGLAACTQGLASQGLGNHEGLCQVPATGEFEAGAPVRAGGR